MLLLVSAPLISMPGEAEYLGQTVRVEVEKPELQPIFGQSGVVLRVSAQEHRVSFMTGKNGSVHADLSELCESGYDWHEQVYSGGELEAQPT